MNSVNIKTPFATWNGVFSQEELILIDQYVLQNLQAVEPVVGVGVAAKPDPMRVSSIYWVLPTNETYWIFERLNAVGRKLNSHFFGFDFVDLKRLQYTIYNEDRQGKYDWHWDCIVESGLNYLDLQYQRKLSMTVLCEQPEEGGDFDITLGSQNFTPTLTVGDAVVFPSFLIHRVQPVTKGIRKSLVAWFEGPDWR